MGDSQAPQWVQDLMQAHQQQLAVAQNQITKLTTLVEKLTADDDEGQLEGPGNRPEFQRTLKSEEIYKFNPSDSGDDVDYFLFQQRIIDLTRIHGKDKVLPALVSCLRNDRAKQWFTGLSDEDKEELATSTDAWVTILKRDFGIRAARARSLAFRESFSFSQGRRVLQYFNTKTTWLKIAGTVDEPTICQEIYQGLRDPEYKTLIKLGENPKLSSLREDLLEIEAGARALWADKQRLISAIFGATRGMEPSRGRGNYEEDYGFRGSRGRGTPQSEYGFRGSRGRGTPQGDYGFRGGRGRGNPQGDYGFSGSRGRGTPQVGTSYGQRSSSPFQRNYSASNLSTSTSSRIREQTPLAITATASNTPPRSCRHCGGSHWDRECPVKSYHFEEDEYYDDYYDAEYEAAQQYAMSVASSSHNFDEYDDYDTMEDVELDDSISQYHQSSIAPTKSLSRSRTPSTKSLSTVAASSSSPSPSLRAPIRSNIGKAPPSVAVSESQSLPEDTILTHQITVGSKVKVKPVTTVKHVCQTCNQRFTSRSQLFRHLEKTNHFVNTGSEEGGSDPRIVESTASKRKVGSGLAFKDYSYATIEYQVTPDTRSSHVACVDTGGPMSYIDGHLLYSLPWKDSKFTPMVEITIRGVSGTKKSSETVVLNLFLPDVTGKKLAKITGEFHVIDQLDCGLLIGEDIIHPNGIIVDSQKECAYIRECQMMECAIQVTKQKPLKDATVRSMNPIEIPANSSIMVPIKLPRQADPKSDYIFQPYQYNKYLPMGCYVMRGIVSGDQKRILLTNFSDEVHTVSHHTRIGRISSMDNKSAQKSAYWPSASQELSTVLPDSQQPSTILTSDTAVVSPNTPTAAISVTTHTFTEYQDTIHPQGMDHSQGDVDHHSLQGRPSSSAYAGEFPVSGEFSRNSYSVTVETIPELQDLPLHSQPELRARSKPPQSPRFSNLSPPVVSSKPKFHPKPPNPNHRPITPRFTGSRSQLDKVVESVKSILGVTSDSAALPKSSKYRADLVHVNTLINITPEQVEALRDVLRKHEKLFANKLGFAKETDEELLRIPLFLGAERELKSQKPYRLSPEERKQVDEVFDRQRAEGRLVDAEIGSPVGWQVFVVKKNGKWRPVVDLRPLNAVTVPDAYPLPIQEDIVDAIKGMVWLSIFDLLMAYYQRGVHPANWWKLAIVTHRGHEMFTVAPMGFCNSVAHQQRYMDKLLKKFLWKIAACYLDDIVVFSMTFEDHLRDIDDILTVLKEAGLTLKPEKCLVGFHSIKMLGKIVDKYGMTTMEDRVEAITSQMWPKTLDALETFLAQCGYLSDQLPYFTQVIKLLRRLKTKLFRGAPSSLKRASRKQFARNICLDQPTPVQAKAFDLVKDMIKQWISKTHIDYSKPIIMYVDASRKWGYGIALYQLEGNDGSIPLQFTKSDLRSIMFLSRELKPAESHYYPTELEAGGLIWALTKLRHIVQTCQTVVYTDHWANEAISKMKGLQTTSPMKKNLRLANWSLFMSQFWHQLDVRYCAGVENIMADALSRLRCKMIELSEEDKIAEELRNAREKADKDDVHSFNTDELVSVSLVQLDDDFKKSLLDSYAEDLHFGLIVKIFQKQLEDAEMAPRTPSSPTPIPENSTATSSDSEPHQTIEQSSTNGPLTNPIPPKSSEFLTRPRSPYKFSKSSNLLYYEDPIDGRLRLCILRKQLKEVFYLAHDTESHFAVAKTYARMVSSFFAPQLLRRIKQWVAYCPKCQINRTLREKPHGLLQPIKTIAPPLHTLTLDFIVSFPSAKRFACGEQMFDAIMSVTDKLSKCVRLPIGRTDYTAVDWATVYWNEVYPDWRFPNCIISDRDPKFLSEFWQGLFAMAKTKLLASTAYHPQTDGQSERTNQTTEIALRYYVSTHQDDWPDHLPSIQAAINTSVSKSTGKTPFEVLYGFNPRHALDLVTEDKTVADDWAELREAVRKDAIDSIVHAQQEWIKHSDPKRQNLSFQVSDKVFLRLSTGKNQSGYTLPSRVKPKLSQQRAGPFEITKVVGHNAYQLKLPTSWRIHDVISVVYLDPAPKGKDPYDRTPEPLPPVIKNADDPDARWSVDSVVNKRVINRGRRSKVQYLVRFEGYGPHDDEWMHEDELWDCEDLVRKYELAMGNVSWSPPGSWSVLRSANEEDDDEDA